MTRAWSGPAAAPLSEEQTLLNKTPHPKCLHLSVQKSPPTRGSFPDENHTEKSLNISIFLTYLMLLGRIIVFTNVKKLRFSKGREGERADTRQKTMKFNITG